MQNIFAMYVIYLADNANKKRHPLPIYYMIIRPFTRDQPRMKSIGQLVMSMKTSTSILILVPASKQTPNKLTHWNDSIMIKYLLLFRSYHADSSILLHKFRLDKLLHKNIFRIFHGLKYSFFNHRLIF